MLSDTIAAISTPLGEGGIGIVRLSGPEAFDIAKKVFMPAEGIKWWKGNPGHRLFYGHVAEPRSGEIIDEVLLGVMAAPKSYTKEDVVEFNCHGGLIPLRRTLEIVLGQGARLAEPGEFSRRAFLNGRLDLIQAEAIIDIIRAKTDTGLKLAVSQLKGDFSGKIGTIQKELTALLAEAEACIDFPEDYLPEDRVQTRGKLVNIIDQVVFLISSAEKGKIYREGILAVIAGRPNVGKSSLLNALLREKRAIVTEIPGTTRDIIEEVINIKGIPIKIADTAGLRPTDDPVESIGVQRSQKALLLADLVLFVIDAVQGFTKEDRELLEGLRKKRKILLINKVDLIGAGRGLPAICLAGESPVLEISAKTGAGLEELSDTIEKMVFEGKIEHGGNYLVSNVRHRDVLRRCEDHLKEALQAFDEGLPEDLQAVDLRSAWVTLGEITGSTATEEIIDHIFANFCIGK
ncbi:MAG TPA: tRNA uridine-5-carboxymethylaminomethyl(34) synthesis GTPase MnmE [Desulfotomaculum sp.]|nr:MAG: tRNA modification GTPase MnmE [Desulfotomaculum sp. 46_296]HAG10061.1 tRNA uridine-5-carboxymethylaminomethyl(34) synthesis GTPase MnmE [Desulfotomaculum sp.]HBY04491.1 tRNA uridine-5-carboxymethylaminomethyl(34) synthesis GTPase MnmE [Desulfotomaculum sp.]